MPVYDFDCRGFAWFSVPNTVASGVVYNAYLQFNSPSSPPAQVGTINVFDLNNHTKADFLNVSDPSTRYDTLGSWANGNYQGDAYPLQTTSHSIPLIHYTDPSGIWERAFANGEEAGFVFISTPLRGDDSPADDSTNIDLSNITLRLDYAPPPTKIGPADGATFLVGRNSRVDWSCNQSSTNVNYRVWYSRSPDFSTIDYAFITDNPYYETNSLPAGRWYWRVQSRLKNIDSPYTGTPDPRNTSDWTNGAYFDVVPDTTAPTPNPSTWATAPYATGTTSISMTATGATDPEGNGVQYFFHSLTVGGHDSGWQSGATYQDTGLSPNTAYTYQVRTRDLSPNQNMGSYSATASATTQQVPDTTAPTPNPSTWATAPYTTGTTSVSMTATGATDPEGNGVQYFFHCLTAGGHDSVWQSGATYQDTGLSPNTAYTYQVRTRDLSANQNMGSYSATASATTQQVPDINPPTVTIGSPSATTTAGGPVNYTVTYADANFSVSALSVNDITLNRTGTANGTVEVSGTGPVRTITINDITGDGSLGISLAAGTGWDQAGNPAPSAGPSETFSVDNTRPTVTIDQALVQADPAENGLVCFTVVFSEPVSGFDRDDVYLATPVDAAPGQQVEWVTDSDDHMSFEVAISAVGRGTITASVPAEAARDAAGNASLAATGTDNTVTYLNWNSSLPWVDAVPDQAVAEDSAATNIPLSGIAAGQGAKGSILVTATSSNPKLIPTPRVSYKSPGTTGSLSFKPVADQIGTSIITVTVLDAGPDGKFKTADDRSFYQTFTVTATPVNHRPSFRKGSNVSVLEDSGRKQIVGWVSSKGVYLGPANESWQKPTFALTTNRPELFNEQPTIDPATGTLSFTPTQDAFGKATVTVTMNDHGGGQEVSLPQIFTIDVKPVNDKPSFSLFGDVTVAQDSGPASRPGWLTGFVPGPANEALQKLATVLVTTNNPKLFAKAPAIDAKTGNLAFTPAKGASGQATVTVRVKDNGGAGSGGVDTSDPLTFTITVTKAASVMTQSAINDTALSAVLHNASVIDPLMLMPTTINKRRASLVSDEAIRRMFAMS